jgi:predicted transcriptional regulator
VAITLHPDAELESALTALAEAEGTTKQEVVRRAVLERDAWTVRDVAVDESTGRMIDRWGDVLHHLGDA